MAHVHFCVGPVIEHHTDTPLEYLEDDILGQRIAETEGEGLFDSSQAQVIYQKYLARAR